MAEGVRSRYSRLFDRGEGTDRIQFFSDAVFAIAMTLLVLEIRLPEGYETDLWGALVSLWPSFFAYVLSFAVIGLNWTTHHRKYRVIPRFDNRLIRINLALLLVVAFVPFPTSVLADSGDQVPAVVLYAATVGMLSVLQLWIWTHAFRHGLMEPSVDEGIFRLVRASLLPTIIVFYGSIPFAFLLQGLTPLLWILLWPLGTLFAWAIARRVDGEAAAATPARRSRGSAS